ncbi:hypothetical protein KHA94_09640 [Bacillus sp. FJAT-49705]|uniref:Uncharacterized protein n=1 Tax=Cytobacillus citreus TaxID=2833586 RepID=A0ABS5NRL6_9BACI|nr:hypothetical protein [Cytobacillus citreus]MBS4190451.1 hypothetical protein [Cytobacillus citreus]
MVIQPNMSPVSIVEAWEKTRKVFEKHNVPITTILLQDSIHPEILTELLKELNESIGSSETTCIEGG